MSKWDKKYEKGRKYKVEWERNFAWVSASTEENDKAFCRLCRRSIIAKRHALIQHESSASHKSCIASGTTSKPLTAFFKKDQKRATQEVELMLAVQTACHASIRTIDHLGEILVKYGKKSAFANIKLHRTKCTKLITEVIGPVFKESMLDDVTDKKFSLIIDETTDVSSEKELAIIIRYYSETNQKITDSLLELVPMCSATGETIYNAINDALVKCNLDLTQCIGLGCDGASTMVGQYNSVWSRIHEHNPNCVLMRCICHSLALCIQHGFDKLPSNLGYLLQEIPAWFAHSKLRREEFKSLYEDMTDESPNSDMPFTKLSQTRWLSRGKVISRIYQNWDVLQRYFSAINSDPQKLNGAQRYKAREILNMIHDKANHLYLTFALPIITEFERVNAFFQSDKADPNVALSELNLHFRSLKARVYDTKGNERAISLVDFGAKFVSECQASLKSLPTDTLELLKLRCLGMLKECIAQVEKRLPEQKNVFMGLAALGPDVVLNQIQRCKFVNLPFQYLLSENFQVIEDQYRQVIHIDWRDQFPDNKIPPGSEAFWSGVSKYQNAEGINKFHDLSMYALASLSIPLSNAVVERLFSTVTFVKNSFRNRMSLKTLEAITRIRTTLHFQQKCCTEFEATEKMFTLFNANCMYLEGQGGDGPQRVDDEL